MTPKGTIMKTAAVIAEFNPFHNGHRMVAENVRKETGADYVIALMSGDYVQCGLPAITDRQVRTEMALLGGYDAVISYPVRYATSSAESFGEHAVRILDSLGCVDVLAFGSESGSIPELTDAARLLLEESDDFRAKLKEGLASGLSFPRARSEALPEYAELLEGPNNILGIEYVKAILKTGSKIRPYTLQRIGTDHLDTETLSSLSSASAVRHALAIGGRMPGIAQAIPPESFEVLRKDIGTYGVTSEQDYSLLLADRLWKIDDAVVLSQFADVSEDLANAIMKKRNSFRSFREFAEDLKTKSRTRSHINRALLHLVLGIRKEEEAPSSLYVHVLGFRKSSENFITEMTKSASVPVVLRSSEAAVLLPPASLKVFQEEIHVANLYETVRAQKSRQAFRNVLTKPLIVV
jgi:predicted nucleotidyltransferase